MTRGEIACCSLVCFSALLRECLSYWLLGKTVKGQAGLPVRTKIVIKGIKHAHISTVHDYIFLKTGTTLKDLSDNESCTQQR